MLLFDLILTGVVVVGNEAEEKFRLGVVVSLTVCGEMGRVCHG